MSHTYSLYHNPLFALPVSFISRGLASIYVPETTSTCSAASNVPITFNGQWVAQLTIRSALETVSNNQKMASNNQPAIFTDLAYPILLPPIPSLSLSLPPQLSSHFSHKTPLFVLPIAHSTSFVLQYVNNSKSHFANSKTIRQIMSS